MRIWAAIALCLCLSACGGGGGALPDAHAQQPAGSAPIDSTANIQAMLDAGVAQLPAGNFYVAAPLVIKRQVHLSGQGQGVTVIWSTAAEGIVVAPESANRFSRFHDFSILPVTPRAGKSAFVVRLAKGGFFSNWVIERVEFGNFGGPGAVFDNSVGNENGIFSGTFGPRNWVSGGVQLIQVGDSVDIEGNTITAEGSATGGGMDTTGWPGIEASGRNAARKLVIKGNNVTASGGCIFLHDVAGPVVEGNICEHPTHLGLPYTSQQPGFLQFTNVTGARVVGNSVNLNGLASYGIALTGGALNSLADNDIGPGTQAHVAFLGTSSRNKLSGLNTYRYQPDETVGRITGAATGLLP